MRESYCLLIRETMDTKNTIDKLKHVLANSRIEVEYDSVKQSLIFNFDTREVSRKQTRNAGRKRKTDHLHMTVGEIKKLMEEKRPKEIYELLEISKATYYRRVAQMGEKSDMEWFM